MARTLREIVRAVFDLSLPPQQHRSSSHGAPRTGLLSFGIAAVMLVFAAYPAGATSITDVLVLQQGGNGLSIDLGAHPGALVNPTIPGSLQFRIVVIDNTPGITLNTTFQLTGRPPVPGSVSLFGIGGPVNYDESFPTGPCCVFAPVAGSLTINFAGGNQTVWQFTYVDPVPEPTTIVLLGSTLGLAWWRRRAAGLRNRREAIE